MRHKIRIGALALLVLTVPVFGEKPPKTQKPETPSVDNRVKEIDKSWMATIHGNPSDPKPDAAKTDDSSPNVTTTQDSARDNADQSTAAKPGSAEKPDENPTRLRNPGSDPKSLFPDEDKPSFVGTLFRVLLMFVLMTGVFYGVMRYLKSRSIGGSMGELATTLGSVALAPGKHLQVIDLAGKILVLGVSDAGVQLVTAVDDARTADRIRIWHQSKPTLPKPENLIQKWLLGFGRADLKFWSRPEPPPPDFRTQLGQAVGPSFTAAEPAESVERVRPGASEILEQDLFGPEDELRRMLREQKNRLEKIREPGKKKPSTG
ncbi:MAG TPA: flagellar biosynthetic protein FliO [Leptospiraceae bacterium]|jgi:flagellar biogenesis protein FliO|nr:flagellar biosynthetic protein FliO [Leptospiraceae bacterium]